MNAAHTLSLVVVVESLGGFFCDIALQILSQFNNHGT